MTTTFKTLSEVKAANKSIGHHFFERSTMSFFNSRIETGLLKGKYFITSEQFISSRGVSDPREYTIRIVDEKGQCETLGEFQGYKSLSSAKMAVNSLQEIYTQETSAV